MINYIFLLALAMSTWVIVIMICFTQVLHIDIEAGSPHS